MKINSQGAVLFALLVSFAVGCGSDTAPTATLSGAVTIGGKAVPSEAEASITFRPKSGGPSVSVPIVDGRYTSDDIPKGAVIVMFHISCPTGPVKVSQRTGQEYQEMANLVPTHMTGGVALDISGDNPEQDFAL